MTDHADDDIEGMYAEMVADLEHKLSAEQGRHSRSIARIAELEGEVEKLTMMLRGDGGLSELLHLRAENERLREGLEQACACLDYSGRELQANQFRTLLSAAGEAPGHTDLMVSPEAIDEVLSSREKGST